MLNFLDFEIQGNGLLDPHRNLLSEFQNFRPLPGQGSHLLDQRTFDGAQGPHHRLISGSGLIGRKAGRRRSTGPEPIVVFV